MGGPNTGKHYKSQSQRLQAATDAILNKNKTTPPTANGVLQRQPGRPLISSAKLPMLGASKKLNTPTKQPGSGSSAAGQAQRTSAQANATAGADAYDFPEDSEDEQMQAALAASRAGLQAGPAAQPVPKLRRIKTYADRQKRAQQEQLEQRQQQQKDQRNVRRQLNTDVDMRGAHSGDENTPACQSLLPFSNAATPAAAAVGSKPSTLPGDARARQQSAPCRSLQLGIRQFAVTQKPPAGGAASSQLLPAGMLNHGNTCYLNAILQALLSLPCLARDLRQFNCSSSGAGGSSDPGSSSSSSTCSQLRLPPDGVTAAMVTCLQQYQAACSRARGLSGASTAAISPQVVREAMRKRASHWGAMRQEDAHEFFTALLSGLADEVQQAQLEYMQKAGSTRRSQKAPGAPAAAVLALPSADDAAQACQAGDQADVAAAASIPLPDESQQEQEQEDEPQQQQPGAEQQPRQGEAGAAAAEAAEAAGGGSKRPSRSPTPACQLPSMSVSQALCPVTRNFLGCLQHTYTCSVCGKKTVQKEQFNHLILDLPQDDDSSSSDGTATLFASSSGGGGGLFGSSSGGGNRAPVADLSSLLANHFRPESCDKACEGCGASEVQHTVEHAVRRLPRVLVVQLKRFKWVISKDGFPDCRKMPTPVRPDKQLFLGRLCVPGRPVPPLLAALMPPRLIRSAMEAAGEEPPAHHRLLSSSHAADGGSGDGCMAGAAAAAAVAEGGLGGLLQAGDSGADVVAAAAAAAAASGQHSDQEQKQKQPSKRLGSLRPLEDAQEPKKPRTVAGASFAGAAHHHTSDSSLARFWHNSKSGTSAKLGSTKPALAASRLKAPLKQQQLSSWEAPDLDLDDLLGPDVPPPLRRNNSSSAVPQVDLTGLADAADAAARDEFDRDLEQAILLSMQEEQQRQQQQQQPSDTKQQGQGQWADADAAGAAGAHEDGSEPFPDWLEKQYMPAEAAAPPASPVHAGSPADDPPADFAAELRRQQQQARQHRSQVGSGAQHGQSAAAEVDELLSCTPTAAGGADMAVADAIFAFTPPAGAPQRQQQPAADPMDLDAAGAGCTGPPSPALQAPQPDRSGRVSSSMAPGGSQPRPPGQKLGGRALSSGSTPAPLLAALQRIGKDQPKLLQEVQETGLTEEQQMARAIAESMREHQQQQGLGGAPSSAVGEAAAASGGQQQPGAGGPTAEPGSAAAPMEVDGDLVLEDEETILKRVLEESAAEHERQQQQKLQQQQQQEGEDAGTDLTAATAPAPAAEAAAAAGAGAGAAAQSGGGQGARKERPPALLLRLLEDSDYEAEQDELRRSRSRSSSPGSAAAEGAAAAGGGSEPDAMLGQEQPVVQPKRRRGRPRKQQQQQDAAGAAGAQGTEPSAAAPAAAAAAGPGKKQGVLMPRDQGPAATADGLHGAAAAAGPSLQEDKENCSAAADAGTDTDAVPDRSTGRAAGAAAAAAGAKGKAGAKGAKAADGTQRRALKEILGDGSARNAAAGAGPAAAAAAAAAEPPQKPPAVSAAVAASQAAAAAAAAAGRQGAATGAAAAGEGGCGVQELQEGVAAGAVGSWPQDTAASYSLSAVVRHMGDLVSVGHFTSDVLNHEVKRWFHYDDSHVRPLNSIEAVRGACQRDGYLFFYVNDAIAED